MGWILDGHAIDGLPSMLADKRRQECQDIAVADLRVPGEIASRHRMFDEEPSNQWLRWRFILHDRPHRIESEAPLLSTGSDVEFEIGFSR
jgi:hypothetical protein